MACTPNFDYDIFISYAHEDNFTVFDEAHGWIETFYKNIRILLAQKIGSLEDIKIWWDHKKLDGSILFDQSIQEGIKDSAIMLSMLSPSYLKSPYCRKELDLFYRKAQQDPFGLSVGERYRLLNVLLYNIAYQTWPQELNQKANGFPFYRVDSEIEPDEEGYPLPLSHPDFREHMYALVGAITKLLKDMQGNSGKPPGPGLSPVPPSPTPPPPKPSPFCIYFGDVAQNLRALLNRTVSELSKQGYQIICNVPPPYEKKEHEQAVKEKLAMANMSIHLLEQSAGAAMDGESNIWYPQRQVELALETDKPQLVWLPADTNIELINEVSYKTFLNDLENGKNGQKRIEFVRGAKSELTQQIVELIEQVKNPPKLVTGKLAVLLDTHISDLTYADDVGQTLTENGIKPFVNPVEDDPLSNAAVLEERLSKSSKLIFFYGKVKRDWVEERMKLVLHMIIDKNFPIDEFIVYMVPPHKEPNDISLQQRLIKLDIVNNSDTLQVDAHAMEQLLKTVKNKAVA